MLKFEEQKKMTKVCDVLSCILTQNFVPLCHKNSNSGRQIKRLHYFLKKSFAVFFFRGVLILII